MTDLDLCYETAQDLARRMRSRQWQDLVRVFTSYDALLTPTAARTAPPVELRDSDFGTDNEEGHLEGLDMTMVFNFVPQCPAISVPAV